MQIVQWCKSVQQPLLTCTIAVIVVSNKYHKHCGESSCNSEAFGPSHARDETKYRAEDKSEGDDSTKAAKRGVHEVEDQGRD